MPENQVFGRAAGGGISSQKFVEKGRKLWYDKSNMGFEKKEKNGTMKTGRCGQKRGGKGD